MEFMTVNFIYKNKKEIKNLFLTEDSLPLYSWPLLQWK